MWRRMLHSRRRGYLRTGGVLICLVFFEDNVLLTRGSWAHYPYKVFGKVWLHHTHKAFPGEILIMWNFAGPMLRAHYTCALPPSFQSIYRLMTVRTLSSRRLITRFIETLSKLKLGLLFGQLTCFIHTLVPLPFSKRHLARFRPFVLDLLSMDLGGTILNRGKEIISFAS